MRPILTTVAHGPVESALLAALASVADLDAVNGARAALAVALSRLVDTEGSVPAARELRSILADISDIESDDIARFMASVQAPGQEARNALQGIARSNDEPV